jgi:hypothetical protein
MPTVTFDTALVQAFSGALSQNIFVTQTYQALQSFGFNASNSIACVSVCRDELTLPLVTRIAEIWGEAFNFSSLAGMLFLGKTGFSAAYHHAPRTDGRERYVHFALPHIAIGENGEIGYTVRPGHSERSSACGALMAFRDELVSGRVDIELDPDDIEQSLLKHRLFSKIRYGEVPDLARLTQLAHEAVIEDLEHMVSLLVDTERSDYAILTGIQIHGPQERNYVWPGRLYAVVNGQRQSLS